MSLTHFLSHLLTGVYIEEDVLLLSARTDCSLDPIVKHQDVLYALPPKRFGGYVVEGGGGLN